MAFFGLLIIAVLVFSAATVYYFSGIMHSVSALQNQIALYSNIVSVETFMRVVSYSFPVNTSVAELSNWRAIMYASARADRLNISINNAYISVRSATYPAVYAVAPLQG